MHVPKKCLLLQKIDQIKMVNNSMCSLCHKQRASSSSAWRKNNIKLLKQQQVKTLLWEASHPETTVSATVTTMMVLMLLHRTSALHPLLILEMILIIIEEASCSQGTKELMTTTTHWNRYFADTSHEKNIYMHLLSTCVLCSSIDNCTKCSKDSEMGSDFYIIGQGSNTLSFLDMS